MYNYTIMNIGIYTNPDRDIDARATKALVNLLLPKNIKIRLCSELRFSGINLPYCKSNMELVDKSDIVVVFGGDGTILRIAKECAKYKANIFSVNLGSMGFLAETELDEMLERCEEILAGKYWVDNRRILKAECSGKILGEALNEVVVSRGKLSKLLKSEIMVNGSLLDFYHSDGIIVATPTGSTAYSLSAGGPLVEPDVDAFIISPICPHTLHSRPMIVRSDRIISVRILSASSDAHVNFDGDKSTVVSPGKTIEISDSGLVASFIRLNSYNYFKKLREKISHMTINNEI
jgi:NAD+ kinase